MPTTTQPIESRSLVSTLNTFIEIFTDSERGFSAAAADIRDPTLKGTSTRRRTEAPAQNTGRQAGDRIRDPDTDPRTEQRP